MENAPAQEQHRWLQKLVGEWTYEYDVPNPEGEPIKVTGTETVRPIGELWTQAEGSGQMPDGNPSTMLMTLGFDPRTGRFVGSWVGSMMTHLWVYDGWLDESGKVLTLESPGPNFDGSEGLSTYRDIIEILSDDHRTLSGTVQGKDGEWTTFMKTDYYRRKA